MTDKLWEGYTQTSTSWMWKRVGVFRLWIDKSTLGYKITIIDGDSEYGLLSSPANIMTISVGAAISDCEKAFEKFKFERFLWSLT